MNLKRSNIVHKIGRPVAKGLLVITTVLAMNVNTNAQTTNPLLEDSDLKYGALRFDKFQPEYYEAAIDAAIAEHDRQIDAIVKQRNVPDFENTIVALDRAGKRLNDVQLILGNLEHALGDTTLMNILARVTPRLTEHYTSITLNEPLWNRVKQVYDNRDKFTGMDSEDKRLLNETYLGFYNSGANLTGEARDRYRQLNSELSDLGVRYAQNITNQMASPDCRLWLTAEQVEGLPQSALDAARAEAKAVLEAEGKADDGSYLITTYYPSYSPAMKYIKDRNVRKQLYNLYFKRNIGGEYDNTELIRQIVNKRIELAQILGKKNFSEYKLQDTMAQNPETVIAFLNELLNAYKPAMKAELAEVVKYAQASEGPDFKLEPWDYSYWSDKLKNDRYAFNDEDLKPYFELDSTIDGVFGLATTLYGYTFKENKEYPGYHPDVRVYEVYDRDGKILGLLYADFFYRAGKSPGAWMTEYTSEFIDEDGNKNLPLISLVCNFSKPVGDEPVLLTPYEVETFLHEFGHSLHGLSADTKYASLSGTNVYHDFVETFSQFNENYMTQKRWLDSFARHYKTGEPMPEDLVARFIRASQYGAAYACLRQLTFGMLDMAYHTLEQPLADDADLWQFETEAVAPAYAFNPIAGTMMSPSFAHIFSGGYASGYYGYKWSERLDADAFAAFEETGDIFDQATAERFRKMLRSGGTVDPNELYLEFRGHKPGIEAMLLRDGIQPTSK